jgi:hypothetical protein
MYRDWSDFYLLIGSAAAALIGLLFVVSTLTSGLERSAVQRGARLYLTPIVFHLAAVLVLSAVAMVPDVSRPAAAAAASAAAAIGFLYAAMILHGIASPTAEEPPHWTDKYYYGAAPALSYLGLGVVAAAIWLRAGWAPTAEAAIAMVLLLLCIRNAWDLVTWLAPKAGGAQDSSSSGS